MKSFCNHLECNIVLLQEIEVFWFKLLSQNDKKAREWDAGGCWTKNLLLNSTHMVIPFFWWFLSLHNRNTISSHEKAIIPTKEPLVIQRLQLQPSKCMLHVRKPSNTCWRSPHILRCTAVACKRPYSHHLDQQQGYECLSRRDAEKIKYTIQHNNLIKYLSIHATGSDKLTIDKLKTNLDVNTWRLHWNIIPCSEDSSLLLSLEFCHQLCNQITRLSQLLCIRLKEQRYRTNRYLCMNPFISTAGAGTEICKKKQIMPCPDSHPKKYQPKEKLTLKSEN
jgi:hypothetical protein